MKLLKKIIVLTGCVAGLGLGANTVMAQAGGGGGGGSSRFAQFRQQAMDRIREQMDVKDDAEWTAIESKITAVFEAQRDSMGSRFGGMGGGRRSRGGSDTNSSGSSSSSSSSDQSTQRRGGGMFGTPSPEVEALQKVIEDKSSTKADVKAKLAALRAANKAKEAKLEKAQDDLKGILSSRQEAVAVLNGLLK